MIVVRAYAKLNLSLRVRALRADGYHAIDSIVQTIDLADRLEFYRTGAHLQVESPFPPEEDLVYRAAHAVFTAKRAQIGVRIVLKKGIPTGAGLGGGSSDAAVVLDMLDRLVPPRLPAATVARIAADLGGDVPLFRRGGRLHIGGKGELIASLSPGAEAAFLVVIPPLHCDTAAVYHEYDRVHPTGTDLPLIPGENDLEEAAVSLYPALMRYLAAVKMAGGAYWGMTGSGSAVYAAFSSPERAAAARNKLARLVADARVVVCRPTAIGYEEES